jgi:ABC-type lipoprotein export system ATPase subunit
MRPYLIAAAGIGKKYCIGSTFIQVLSGIDLYVEKGEFVAVMGPSGSGKSTLLHILGCLDCPTSGSYRLDNEDVLNASDRVLSRIRANHIGFVFQTFNLVPALNLFENVELPFLYSSVESRTARQRIIDAVKQVGLEDRMGHKPSELSGGEMQRVAIARALAIQPKLILADEPTGNLDSGTSWEILDLFRDLHSRGATIVMVTHDREVASCAQKRIILKDGKIV